MVSSDRLLLDEGVDIFQVEEVVQDSPVPFVGLCLNPETKYNLCISVM